MENFASLPPEVLAEILARAGGAAAASCASVSKRWLAVTRAELTWKLCTKREFPEEYEKHSGKHRQPEWKTLYSSLCVRSPNQTYYFFKKTSSFHLAFDRSILIALPSEILAHIFACRVRAVMRSTTRIWTT